MLEYDVNKLPQGYSVNQYTILRNLPNLCAGFCVKYWVGYSIREYFEESYI